MPEERDFIEPEIVTPNIKKTSFPPLLNIREETKRKKLKILFELQMKKKEEEKRKETERNARLDTGEDNTDSNYNCNNYYRFKIKFINS